MGHTISSEYLLVKGGWFGCPEPGCADLRSSFRPEDRPAPSDAPKKLAPQSTKAVSIIDTCNSVPNAVAAPFPVLQWIVLDGFARLPVRCSVMAKFRIDTIADLSRQL